MESLKILYQSYKKMIQIILIPLFPAILPIIVPAKVNTCLFFELFEN